ncbi:MAG TPA: hypothetical protein VGL70_11810 [Candidatus Binatia bacterium]|jgi:hypothetical protein
MLRKNWKVISLIVITTVAGTVAVVEYRRIKILEGRLDCAAGWLEETKPLHGEQMKNPANFTGENMQKLMDSVDRAYRCATKDPSSGGAPGSGSFGQHPVQPH